MKKVAVFLDAGYFWVQVTALVLGARGHRNSIIIDYDNMRQAVLNEVANQFAGVDLLRVYWYDGPGAHGKTSDHISIEKLDDFKLRLGTRNGVGQQKAVDGLIIADMISLTQSRSISEALLISGDADMTPGVVAAQAMGLRVHLLSIGSAAATSPHLAAEVDRKFSWQQANVAGFASRNTATSTGAATASSAAIPAPTPAHTPAPASAMASAPATPDLCVIAQDAHTTLSTGTHSATLAALSSSTIQIPKEVDAVLLATGKRYFGRPLSELEKRGLRVEFKKLL